MLTAPGVLGNSKRNFIQGIRSIFRRDTPLQERLHWILRISSSLCFIGHGSWGFITKSDWLNFYDIVGIPPLIAFTTMPIVGTIDLISGIILLFAPIRAVMLYMSFWSICTSLLRPLAGMGWWEFFERAGNYGAPLGLLFLSGFHPGIGSWFRVLPEPAFDRHRATVLAWHLRIYTALLMIGHGGYGAFRKKEMLIDHFQSIGFTFQSVDPRTFITFFGWFEIVVGLVVLLRPYRPLLMFVVIWKLLTESLYVTNGPILWETFEFLERAGSYGVPLAFYFLFDSKERIPDAASTPKEEKFTIIFVVVVILITIVQVIPKGFSFRPKSHVIPATLEFNFLKFPIKDLKKGGYIVFFRHTARVQGPHVSDQQRLEDDLELLCTASTELSLLGTQQAEMIGEKIKAMSIPVGEVIASPTCRTQQMAKIMFGEGAFTTNDKLVYVYARKPTIPWEDYNKAVYEVLSKPTLPGKNRFIISHRNVIRHDTIGAVSDLNEGDATVFEPIHLPSPMLRYLGHIRWEDWQNAQ